MDAMDILGIGTLIFILIPSFIFVILTWIYVNSKQAKKDFNSEFIR